MKINFTLFLSVGLFLYSCKTVNLVSLHQEDVSIIPNSLQNQIISQFPEAVNIKYSHYNAANLPIDWYITDLKKLDLNDYTVTFEMNGNKFYSWYDVNGNWVGAIYSIEQYNSLPISAHSLITSEFNEFTVDKINCLFWKDKTAYVINLIHGEEKVSVLLDENGKLIKLGS